MNIKEFFGFGGYSRSAEGYMSWQHLTFVSVLTMTMIALAIILGRKYKNCGIEKNKRHDTTTISTRNASNG